MEKVAPYAVPVVDKSSELIAPWLTHPLIEPYVKQVVKGWCDNNKAISSSSSVVHKEDVEPSYHHPQVSVVVRGMSRVVETVQQYCVRATSPMTASRDHVQYECPSSSGCVSPSAIPLTVSAGIDSEADSSIVGLPLDSAVEQAPVSDVSATFGLSSVKEDVEVETDDDFLHTFPSSSSVVADVAEPVVVVAAVDSKNDKKECDFPKKKKKGNCSAVHACN